MSRRRVEPLGHVKCYIFHRYGHMERDCFSPLLKSKISIETKTKRIEYKTNEAIEKANERG